MKICDKNDDPWRASARGRADAGSERRREDALWDSAPSGRLGRGGPRQQRQCGETATEHDAQGPAGVAGWTDAMGSGGYTHKRALRVGLVWPASGTSGQATRAHGGCSLYAGPCLAPADAPGTVSCAGSALRRRTAATLYGRSARSADCATWLPGPPRTGGNDRGIRNFQGNRQSSHGFYVSFKRKPGVVKR